MYCYFNERPPVAQTTYFVFLLQVKARSAAREVIATYSVDDIFIELVIQLPQNYPLGSITVESGRRVGVAVQQWRNWMLQLNTYLTHQVETPRPSGCKHKKEVDMVKNDKCTFVCSEWQHNGGSGSVEE